MNSEIPWWPKDHPSVIDRYRDRIREEQNKRLPAGFQSSCEQLHATTVRLGEFLAVANNQGDSRTLAEYLSADKNLAPYIAAADGCPTTAVALAKADVAYWRSLRRDGWRTAQEKKQALFSKATKYLIGPLLFAFLTALLGHLIFQRQRFFDAKFQRLESGQRRAVAVLSGVRSRATVLASWEVYGGGLSPREQLEPYKEEIEQIEALGGSGQGSKQVSEAAKKAYGALDAYLSCLEGTAGLKRSEASMSTCSSEFELAPFETLVKSFDSAMNSLEGPRW